MRYIWLTSANTGKDFVAPLEYIGAIFYDSNNGTTIIVSNIKFSVTQGIADILDRIKSVRKLTAPKGKKVLERSSDEILGAVDFNIGMKLSIEKNSHGLVLRMYDPDSNYNSASSGVGVEDLDKLRKLLVKVIKENKDG